MTNYEFSETRKSLIITSEGGKKYNLYFHSKGVAIAYGVDGSGGTIYESCHVDFAKIPHEIRLDVMWTYVEAAIMAVNDDLIENFLTDKDAIAAISKRKIGISRFNEMENIVRTYLIERSDAFID